MDIEYYYPDNDAPEEIYAMLKLVSDTITLEEMWGLMDLAWAKTKAYSGDKRSISEFYSHPMWTLNGIFTERHVESIENRLAFAKYISNEQPRRVADYGGGFGAFSRVLAGVSPNTLIEIVEPYPSSLAQKVTRDIPNVKFVKDLAGSYDVITALDVLEHVEQPLNLVYKLANHVKPNGYLFLANCFYPVIKCHLPCTFYLRHTLDFLLKKLGLYFEEEVLYAKKYRLKKTLRDPNGLAFWVKMAKAYHRYTEVKQFILGFLQRH